MVRSTSSCFKIISCGSDPVDKDDFEQTEGKGSTDKRGWSFRKRSARHRVLSNTMISETPSPGNKESLESSNIDFHAQTNPTVPEKISVSQWTDETPPLSTAVNSKLPAESFEFHAQTNPTVPEQISVSQWTDEMPPFSTAVNPKVPDPLLFMDNTCKIDSLISTESASKIDPLTAMENACKIDPLTALENASSKDPLTAMEDVIKIDPLTAMENSKDDLNLEESLAIAIQSAIRGYLAQRALLKLKNVVKLQAAVRGHLVRRQAVGTLRCVQAIVKMQALVRARRARMSGSVIEEKLDGKHERNNKSVKLLGKENFGTKANINYSSTEKLLSNGFARQLLESTPKKKQIHIKCDPSRPDSAWKWLERWMTVSSSEFAQTQKPQFSPEYQAKGEIIDTTASEVGTEIPAEISSESVDMKSSIRETAVPLEGEENLITYDANNFDFDACFPTPSSIINTNQTEMQPPQLEDAGVSKAQETSSKIDTNQTEMQLDAASQNSISDKLKEDSEQPKHSTKRVASEQAEAEGKKFVLGARKACNPAFAAAQSKFEELSSTTTSGRSISYNQDAGVESKLDSLSSPADSLTRTKELRLAENLMSHHPRVRVGGSECGTELSISSTLDSPDRSEVGDGEFDNEAKVAEEVISDPNNITDNASNLGNLDVEAMNNSSMSHNPTNPVDFLPGKLEDVNGESVDSVVAVDSLWVEQQPERSASDVQIQLETTTDQQAYRSSPEGSPRSHITAPESHGTPSSQVSVKAKREKVDKSGCIQNRKSQSAGKRSPSNPNHDSGVRSSTEQSTKEPKNGKRRNSFGSVRPDHVDQEPSDGSSNSLPNYMQATESARAKAQANNSPRSRPDVQDKDIYIKKRHSLPGANGKQGSPRMQQATSQIQQGAKGIHTRSPGEKMAKVI